MYTLNAPSNSNRLADARQWFIDGKDVYVTISAEVAELHIRGMIVAARPVAEINSATDAQDWAVEFLAAEAEAMNEDADRQLAATIEHMDASEVSEAVAQVRADGARRIAQAAELAAQGDAPVQIVTSQGRKITRYASDPRHPFRAAESARRAGERLSRWTQADEDAYGRYVSDGLADTDGYYAPLDRAAWSYGR